MAHLQENRFQFTIGQGESWGIDLWTERGSVTHAAQGYRSAHGIRIIIAPNDEVMRWNHRHTEVLIMGTGPYSGSAMVGYSDHIFIGKESDDMGNGLSGTQTPAMHAQANVLDSVVAQRILAAAAGGNGFVLGLMGGLDDETLATIDQLRETSAAFDKGLARCAELQAIEQRSEDDEEELKQTAQNLLDAAGSSLRAIANLNLDSGHRSIEVKESLPPIDVSPVPTGVRRHWAHDLESLAEMCLTMGSDMGVAVYIGDSAIIADLDEWALDGDQETVTMGVEESDVCAKVTAWDQGESLGQKALVQLLTRWQQYVPNLGWLEDLRNLSGSVKIDVETGIQRGENRQQVTTVSTAGPKVLNLPNDFTVRVPILTIDDTGGDDAKCEEIKVLLEVDLPTETSKAFAFKLVPIGLEAAKRRRRRELVHEFTKALADARVRLEDLSEWKANAGTPVLVLRGQPVRERRTVGLAEYVTQRI